MKVGAAASRKAWRQERLEERAKRRAQATARVHQPIPEDLRRSDPLRHPGRNKTLELLQLGIFLVVAVGLHVGILAVFFGAGSVVAAMEKKGPPKDNKIEVTMVTPPPPPPPPEPEPPPPEPEPEAKPKEAPKAKAPPPPDPIDVPKEPPPPEPPKAPPRRIVGLSLESTVGGGEGGGPSFAVGNTRMGNTEKVAADAKQVTELPKDPTPPPPPPPNRVASRVPSKGTDGPALVKPKRKSPVKPGYPETLKAQGLEADVTVEVVLDTRGKVKTARVIAPSPYPEFNEAALASAKTEEFSPAERDGQPIEFTLTFTVRFRLTD
ncbi:MAG: energy transducer TonB [Deltaproteobacteria bacterium]|nr:energy transducer TonB [Deltaproteobacteria bacterium]